MKKSEPTGSYTLEELNDMAAGGEDRTDWARVVAKTKKDLTVDTAGDSAWDGIDAKWIRDAVATTAVLARPKENKKQITLRLDADLLEFFKSDGRGWQGRMNAVLRSYMNRRA